MSMSSNGLWGILGMGSLCGAAAFARSKYERDHFVVEETTVSSPKIKKEYTLVFLTDLHDKEFEPGNERLIHAIKYIRPDFVLIGGDTMVTKEGKAKLDVTKRLLGGLAGLAPIYYANGNHEQRMAGQRNIYGDMYDQLLSLFKEYGVHYLSNTTETVGADLSINGLNIEWSYYKNVMPNQMKKTYLDTCLGKPNPQRFQILLAHSPMFFSAYCEWGADLVLAGHFHGGTIRIPKLGGLMTPQYQFFFPYCAGTFEEKGKKMIVGRGLGTHSVNLRLGNKPQLVVVRLVPETIF